jgi:dienelactone hydrolase
MTVSCFFAPGAAVGRALLISGVWAAGAFALGGTVRNGAGTPVSGALVSLASDTTLRQTTDSTGTFALNVASAVFDPGFSATGETPARISVRDGRVRFVLGTPVREARLTLFSSEGARRFDAVLGALGAGPHEVAVPALASRLHYLRVSLDGVPFVKQLVPSGHGPTVRPVVSVARATPSARVSATVDTVVVRKGGYPVLKTPIESYARADLVLTLRRDTVALLPAITDYSANGPFATVVEANVGPENAYTIIRPETLGANGFLHAPIIYGHGINAQVSGFTGFLRNVASHGFVIIARNVLTGGPNNAANTAAMNNGLNWILQQNATPGSIYQGKLATDRAAAMGYSVGGTAAVDIGGHPALRTVVSIHGHISSAVQRGPLLQTSGTLDNVGLPMQQQTFANSTVQTFLGTVTGANHGYIQSNNGGAQRPAIVAWLRYWLYYDQGAKPYFYGNACVMCVAPWENPQRKHWE